jgi:protoporphyrinogen oxidase
MRPGFDLPLNHEPPASDAYRFEVGGGHWIFGGDPATVSHLEHLVDVRVYQRRAVVRIGDLGCTVPYPLQANVDALGPRLAETAHNELALADFDSADTSTLHAALSAAFGKTLCEIFFFPFHDRYTAGMMRSIANQDTYKSPRTGGHGYNASFRYPVGGLDRLSSAMAARCDVRYGKRLVGINRRDHTLEFDDGTEHGYDRLLSTLPLHHALALAAIDVGEAHDPYTSVLVLNIGAERGPMCPDVHWQYEPDSRSGFHRIGFYSNVDPDFLPATHRDGSHVSMYVERAYAGGERPSADEVVAFTDEVIEELQAREYIGTPEVAHPSWVDVAYTWRSPGSTWKARALDALAAGGIQQIGRYGRWHFQGIADSIREGLANGRTVATSGPPVPQMTR